MYHGVICRKVGANLPAKYWCCGQLQQSNGAFRSESRFTTKSFVEFQPQYPSKVNALSIVRK